MVIGPARHMSPRRHSYMSVRDVGDVPAQAPSRKVHLHCNVGSAQPRHLVRPFGIIAGGRDCRSACAGDHISIKEAKCPQHFSGLVRVCKPFDTFRKSARKFLLHGAA